MPKIFICSTGDQAGQSLMTLAIFRRLSEKGLKVGLFKPFGADLIYHDSRWVDHDIVLLKDIMDLEEPLDHLNPYPSPENDFSSNNSEDILKNIKSICEELYSKNDVLILIGSNDIFFDNNVKSLSDITLIKELNGFCVLINRFRKSSASIYSIFSVSSLLKDRLKGVLINRVPEETDEDTINKMSTTLTDKGIPVISILHEDPFLSSSSLREIKQLLDGKLLCCEEEIGRLVGEMTVGSAYLKGDLGIFKRSYNKIILLKPSSNKFRREDQNQQNISGIILTGEIFPASQMLSAAEKAKIPIMVIKSDTFSALECLGKKTSVLSSGDIFKVSRFTELLDDDNGFDKFLKSLDILN